MTRQITYSIHTENGTYNPTFLWSNIQQYLDFLARYKDVAFVRNNNGRIKFIQSKQNPTPGVAMWTNRASFRTWIAPGFNFKQINMVCARCLLHEFFHMCSALDHLPGKVALMSTTGGSAGNITEADYQYISAYAWKTSLRPHHEPNKMAQTFAPATKMQGFYADVDDRVELAFGCPGAGRPWYHKLTPTTFLVP